jgi:carbamoyl-phosphate synthase large subunit
MACDASAGAPALAVADQRMVVPALDDPSYFDVLLAICREKRVRLLVSVNDLELPGLAQHAPRFREIGTIALVPAPDAVARCQDKWLACGWLKQCGIATPETYLSVAAARAALACGALAFPLLIKPRWGTSSIGIELAENERELELACEWAKVNVRRTILARMHATDPEHCLVIQERLDGPEYGLDVVNDLAGRHVATFARRKLAMRAGNTDRAVTVQEPQLERLGAIIGQHLMHVGCVDCDVMVTEKGCCVLDVNPRLGGGYPFSHVAGANLPAALLAWANGEEPDPAWLRPQPGVLSAKYDGVLVIERSLADWTVHHAVPTQAAKDFVVSSPRT